MTHVAEPVRTAVPQALPADLPERAVKLAAELLQASRARETAADRQRAGMMARMMQDDAGKKFTIVMTDQVLKMEQPERAAARLGGLLQHYGLPKYLGAMDRMLLWAGAGMARLFPRWLMPQVSQQVKRQSRHVIVSAEPDKFADYVARRKADGFRINFNQLGEAVLGNGEADRRLQAYLDRLRGSEVGYCSVKLSSVVSQISLTGYAQTLDLLKDRLRTLYRAAMASPLDGRPRFVNLDMEEYRDLDLTVDTFTQVLDEPEFEKLEAGIVLQAYLPDSFRMQQRLTDWAIQRHQRTGAGIKIRLVKGANLAMEQVEAALRDWPQAPYGSKLESDANFKRMLEYATRPEHAAVVRVGVASHNLFDVAWALLVRELRGVANRVEFEMLEGMANAQALEVRDRSGGMTVYTPAVPDKEFEAAVAYLVRRLDENTAPGSFLGALFGLEEGSPQWQEQSGNFLRACELAAGPELSSAPQRQQNRLTEQAWASQPRQPFHNTADTDFSLPANREWAERIVNEWREKKIEPIPVVMGDGGEENRGGTDKAGALSAREAANQIGRDPSRPGREAYRFAVATLADVNAALDVAVKARPAWAARGIAGRAKVLREAAAVFARQRGDTIGAMLTDAGKTIIEADVEISEAIDFADYYAGSLDQPGWFDGTQAEPLGVVVVTPPWNFPYAIPAGGCLAALMAGNSVILKPSRESVLTAWMLARQLWEAGVPRDVLQFLPVADRAAGKQLVVDPRTAAVILTGSFDTARNFQTWRPDLPLFAETSGKNSLIITVNADLDLAVKDLVRGAFGHSGQKCSATSLALIERPVYESQKFRHQLLDAARSLVIGGSWDTHALATPVIRPPDQYLERGLTKLDEGEEWLLEPKMIGGNPCHWSPGIRLGVKPGSWYHRTECFGPVLGLICVESFEHGIEIQNSNEFGLTGGLHSLDPDEIRIWRERVEVGNAYINRGTTGAIVQRQPFGGWKHSVVGPGAKAGGPNYVSTLCRWRETELPGSDAKSRSLRSDLGSDPLPGKVEISPDVREMLDVFRPMLKARTARERLDAAVTSYAYWWSEHFSRDHDPSQVHGETNDFRYRPRPWHLLRINDPKSETALAAAQLTAIACRLAGVRLELSFPRGVDWTGVIANLTGGSVQLESHELLLSRLAEMRDGTVRVLDPVAGQAFEPTRIGNLQVIRGMPLANGRIELLHYLREQSVSQTVHRYGNIL